MAELTREQIDDIKKKRATQKRMMQDRLRYVVGMQSVPAIMIMVAVLVGSAYYLKSESLAVVSGLVATVTMGLINVLQQMTAPPEKESEMSKALTETNELLKQQLKKDNSGTEVRMDKNYVSIGKDGHSKVVTSNDKDLVWGEDKKKK